MTPKDLSPTEIWTKTMHTMERDYQGITTSDATSRETVLRNLRATRLRNREEQLIGEIIAPVENISLDDTENPPTAAILCHDAYGTVIDFD